MSPEHVRRGTSEAAHLGDHGRVASADNFKGTLSASRSVTAHR